MSKEITILLSSPEPQGPQLLPAIGLQRLAPFKVEKGKLAKSLTELVKDVNEIIKSAQTNSNFAQLESISITAEISAEGGVNWIGLATAGYNNAMTLTFKIRRKRSLSRQQRTK
jgi:hypothetical protein